MQSQNKQVPFSLKVSAVWMNSALKQNRSEMLCLSIADIATQVPHIRPHNYPLVFREQLLPTGLRSTVYNKHLFAFKSMTQREKRSHDSYEQLREGITHPLHLGRQLVGRDGSCRGIIVDRL